MRRARTSCGQGLARGVHHIARINECEAIAEVSRRRTWHLARNLGHPVRWLGWKTPAIIAPASLAFKVGELGGGSTNAGQLCSAVKSRVLRCLARPWQMLKWARGFIGARNDVMNEVRCARLVRFTKHLVAFKETIITGNVGIQCWKQSRRQCPERSKLR